MCTSLIEANQVPKGTILLKKGEKTEFLLLVIKGRVAAYNEDIFYMVIKLTQYLPLFYHINIKSRDRQERNKKNFLNYGMEKWW